MTSIRPISFSMPEYFGSLSFFHRLLQTKFWVATISCNYFPGNTLLDTVIADPKMGKRTLSVPIVSAGPGSPPLALKYQEIRQDTGWKHQHIKAIDASYKMAPYRSYVLDIVNELHEQDYNDIGLLNYSATTSVLERLKDSGLWEGEWGIDDLIVDDIELDKVKGSKSFLLFIERLYGSSIVCSKDEESVFNRNELMQKGIKVKPIVYEFEQGYGPRSYTEIADLSILDVMAWKGPDFVKFLLPIKAKVKNNG